jgi:hypothetical protein
MDADMLHHDVPNPLFQRVLLSGAGLFALVVSPYELWRGVWPLNLTTPFFAIIMFGGMGVGAALLWAGMFSPGIDIRMDSENLIIESRTPFGAKREIIPAQSVTAIEIEVSPSSDGPDSYHAVILTRQGRKVASRPMGSRQAADRIAEEFRSALGFNG